MAHPPALKVSAGERREKNRPFLQSSKVCLSILHVFSVLQPAPNQRILIANAEVSESK